MAEPTDHPDGPGCGPGDHDHSHAARTGARRAAAPHEIERAARLLQAMADPARLKTLELLAAGEACVTEIAEATRDKLSTVSQRLRLLRLEGLVSRRREGRHIFYGLADRHILDLIQNALDHAAELAAGPLAPDPE